MSSVTCDRCGALVTEHLLTDGETLRICNGCGLRSADCSCLIEQPQNEIVRALRDIADAIRGHDAR